MAYQLEVLFKNAVFASSQPNDEANEQNTFEPSTYLSLPLFTRSSRVNEQDKSELKADCVTSEVHENSANPTFNFSVRFEYNHLHHLINDLLLAPHTNCTVFAAVNSATKEQKKSSNAAEHAIFGVIKMEWRKWVLSYQDGNAFAPLTLPIIDAENDTLNQGEVEVELSFFTKSQSNADSDQTAVWQKCKDFCSQKHMFLTIAMKNLQSVPRQWFKEPDTGSPTFIHASFDVVCGQFNDGCIEAISIDVPLHIQQDTNADAVPVEMDQEWVFFLDEHGINYYLEKAREKQSFDIKFEHICADDMSTDKKKKKAMTRTTQHACTVSLNLRPFAFPGTDRLSDVEHVMRWSSSSDDDDNADVQSIENQSTVGLQFIFSEPLIAPYVKQTVAASQLLQQSNIRAEHEQHVQNSRNTSINSRTKFQAILSSIQEQLTQKYLNICTTFDDGMNTAKRKQLFLTRLLSSANGQRYKAIIENAIAAIAREEMNAEDQALMTEELSIKLRAKLHDAYSQVFVNDEFEAKSTSPMAVEQPSGSVKRMKPFLDSKNTENVYAAQMRDIQMLRVLIEIAMLNQDYDNGYKWVVQAMMICDDAELYSVLLMHLAFVYSQTQNNRSLLLYCVQQALSITESKDACVSLLLLLCEDDKLEQAQPFVDNLLQSFGDDPDVHMLSGLFEYLVEETEDAQRIWSEQGDGVEACTLYALWVYLLRIALRMKCTDMADTILKVSAPFFDDAQCKVEHILLEYHVLMSAHDYTTALSRLGAAVLINDQDARIWMCVGCTYLALHKHVDAMEAFERHIQECERQKEMPNLFGQMQLIEIYVALMKDKESASYEEKAAALIETCWQRIQNNEVDDRDTININVLLQSNRDSLDRMQALTHKLNCIHGNYCDAINDVSSAITHFSNASYIHPFDDTLWSKLDNIRLLYN